jgi:NAD(P)H-hydrate epimerase
VPENLLPYYVLRAPELLLKGINEGDRYAFNEEKMKELLRYDSIAFGMGMGATKETARGAKYLLRNYTGALILDADALNALAEEDDVVELFINKTCDVILTPHGKEFFRLTGKDIDWQRNNGVSAPTAFAKESGVNVLLKNAVSVLTDGRKTFVNTTGTSGQAKGGSGDVLSGVIAGLCAQGLTTFDAGVAGAYLVGKAAEIACRTVGEYSLLARDVIGALGSAFLSLDD